MKHLLIALLDTFIHPTIYLRLSKFISCMCKVPVPFHQNVSFLRVQKCVHFGTIKKTDKRSLNLWTNPFGTSPLICILFDTTSFGFRMLNNINKNPDISITTYCSSILCSILNSFSSCESSTTT